MPLVSVCCVTYNHADFIKQTLEGFVTQKTNFPFEVIIADEQVKLLQNMQKNILILLSQYFTAIIQAVIKIF